MFGRKKETPLDRRIKELRKEMAKLDSELRALRSPDAPFLKHTPAGTANTKVAGSFIDSSAQKTTIADVDPSLRAEKENVAPSSTYDALAKSSFKPSTQNGDLFSYAERKRSPLRDDIENFSEEARQKREKFAHYFMAGHFQNLKPLRQEKRIMRNKLIAVLIAIFLLICWLLYYFYII